MKSLLFGATIAFIVCAALGSFLVGIWIATRGDPIEGFTISALALIAWGAWFAWMLEHVE